ncbi:nucleotidyltransferase family protein [Larkinella soli]|uniref:nucleotidyltransferase family protein n=1 Tax=Larkinella soli TaxID=1770527 RepID=UPI000FFB20D4|nr:nucleotidyltransferase family protein [Larkinella soli]
MNAEAIKEILKANKEALFQRYPLKTMALFGSYADGTATEESDVDIMVEFSQPVGFEVVDLAIELEELLHKRVDLITRKAIKPSLMSFVSRQLQYV